MIVDLVNEIFSTTLNILLVHAVEWEVCSKMTSVVTQLFDRVPSLHHVQLALKLAHLLIRFLFIERATGKEMSSDCDGEVLALIKLAINSRWLDSFTSESLSEQVI